MTASRPIFVPAVRMDRTTWQGAEGPDGRATQVESKGERTTRSPFAFPAHPSHAMRAILHATGRARSWCSKPTFHHETFRTTDGRAVQHNTYADPAAHRHAVAIRRAPLRVEEARTNDHESAAKEEARTATGAQAIATVVYAGRERRRTVYRFRFQLVRARRAIDTNKPKRISMATGNSTVNRSSLLPP